MRAKAAFVFGALTLFAAPFASAEEVDLSGNWSVATSLRPCTLTGKATLAPTADTSKSDYACELTMRQSCPSGYEVVVRQSCRVRNVRGQVTIQSSIEEFVQGPFSPSYAPDNFRLTVQSDQELYGAQIDRYGTLSATWTRATGSIS